MFAIYLPARTGANPKHLADVGLGDLLSPGDESPSFTDLSQGPDGGQGLVVHWGGAIYASADFDWTKSPRLDANSSTPAFWLGKSGTLGLDDFARKRQLRGQRVTLADGNDWTIAVAQQLPCVLGLDAGGAWTGVCDPQYSAYYAACWGFWDALEVSSTSGGAVVSWSKGADFACQALAVNYRVNRDVVAWLGLLRDDLLWEIAKAAVEFDTWGAMLQKKTDPPSDAGLPSIVSGVLA
ncbi:MAG TPA: hypothetical protein VGX76_06865 [Pirellulales bacterium]|jgi:hypothetical protein|nr:hypothetical protein [Pirellulales bacterium]